MPRINKTGGRKRKPVPVTPEISKSEAEIYLAKVPEDKVFWNNDGRILTDIKDLEEALIAMSDQTFAYHSNDIKKDYSVWIRDVMGDNKLAGDLETASNREQAAKIVRERYIYLSEKAR